MSESLVTRFCETDTVARENEVEVVLRLRAAGDITKANAIMNIGKIISQVQSIVNNFTHFPTQ